MGASDTIDISQASVYLLKSSRRLLLLLYVAKNNSRLAAKCELQASRGVSERFLHPDYQKLTLFSLVFIPSFNNVARGLGNHDPESWYSLPATISSNTPVRISWLDYALDFNHGDASWPEFLNVRHGLLTRLFEMRRTSPQSVQYPSPLILVGFGYGGQLIKMVRDTKILFVFSLD